jgi:nitroreductase
MEVFKAIKNRRSIREFQKREIPREIIERLIEAIIWAPSAGNLQSRKFYFVFNEKIKDELVRAALNQDFIAQAPLVVVGCLDTEISWRYGKRGIELYSICDVSTSIQNLMLEATELGLGTCWVGAFDEEEVSKILNLPKNLRPVAIIPVGYPAEKPSPPKRKEVEEVITKIE